MEDEIKNFNRQIQKIIKEAKQTKLLSDKDIVQLKNTTEINELIKLLYPIGYTIAIVPLDKSKYENN